MKIVIDQSAENGNYRGRLVCDEQELIVVEAALESTVVTLLVASLPCFIHLTHQPFMGSEDHATH